MSIHRNLFLGHHNLSSGYLLCFPRFDQRYIDISCITASHCVSARHSDYAIRKGHKVLAKYQGLEQLKTTLEGSPSTRDEKRVGSANSGYALGVGLLVTGVCQVRLKWTSSSSTTVAPRTRKTPSMFADYIKTKTCKVSNLTLT